MPLPFQREIERGIHLGEFTLKDFKSPLVPLLQSGILGVMGLFSALY